MATCRSANQSYRRMRLMSCLSLLVSLVSPLSIQSKKFHTSPLKKSVKNDRVMIATRNLSRSMPSVAVITKWPTIVIGWFLWWFVPFTVTTVKITDIPIIRNVSHDYGILVSVSVSVSVSWTAEWSWCTSHRLPPFSLNSSASPSSYLIVYL